MNGKVKQAVEASLVVFNEIECLLMEARALISNDENLGYAAWDARRQAWLRELSESDEAPPYPAPYPDYGDDDIPF